MAFEGIIICFLTKPKNHLDFTVPPKSCIILTDREAGTILRIFFSKTGIFLRIFSERGAADLRGARGVLCSARARSADKTL